MGLQSRGWGEAQRLQTGLAAGEVGSVGGYVIRYSEAYTRFHRVLLLAQPCRVGCDAADATPGRGPDRDLTPMSISLRLRLIARKDGRLRPMASVDESDRCVGSDANCRARSAGAYRSSPNVSASQPRANQSVGDLGPLRSPHQLKEHELAAKSGISRIDHAASSAHDGVHHRQRQGNAGSANVTVLASTYGRVNGQPVTVSDPRWAKCAAMREPVRIGTDAVIDPVNTNQPGSML
jgi:hypothetical protein